MYDHRKMKLRILLLMSYLSCIIKSIITMDCICWVLRTGGKLCCWHYVYFTLKNIEFYHFVKYNTVNCCSNSVSGYSETIFETIRRKTTKNAILETLQSRREIFLCGIDSKKFSATSKRTENSFIYTSTSAFVNNALKDFKHFHEDVKVRDKFNCSKKL